MSNLCSSVCNSNELDFFDKVAYQLIGLEVIMSRKIKPNIEDGFTLGRARIKRLALKIDFGIDSDYKFSCLQDALNEHGYMLVVPNYADDLILINLKSLRCNAELISDAFIKDNVLEATKEASTYMEARKVIDQRDRK